MKKNAFKKFINYISVCITVVVITFGITIALNYFLSDRKLSFSSKSAEINYVEYSDKSTYNLKITKSSSWREEDLNGYIFNIDITNISTDNLNDLDVKLDFGNAVSINDANDASYSNEGSAIYIKPLESKSSIPVSETYSYEFIVHSSSAINVENIVIDFKGTTYKLQSSTTY